MFPFRDHNPSGRTPYVTFALIAVNVAVFLAMLPSMSDPYALMAVYQTWGMVPAGGNPAGYLTSMFLHGGLMHLGGNMLFLWVFGDNIEDELGPVPFLGFYLLSGLASAIAQALAEPASTVPVIGASGAVAGVMGGYLLLYPKARVDVLVIIFVFIRIIPVPAWIVLGLWFAIQLFSGAMMPTAEAGVAYWAHAGGFLAGMAMVLPVWLRKGGPEFWNSNRGLPPHPVPNYRIRRSTIPRVRRRR